MILQGFDSSQVVSRISSINTECWLNCPLSRCAGGTIAAWNHGGGLSADATGKKTRKKSRLVFHLGTFD